MNKKFFALIISVTIVASLVATVMAVNRGIDKKILPLPKVKVVHVEAEFKGVRTAVEKAVCEDDTRVEPGACSIVSQALVYSGEISGFVNGKFVANGRAINDRNTGWGYVEGKLSIFDSNGKLLYNGKFQGAKQRLPTITTDTTQPIQEVDAIPLPKVWLINGSIDLVGTKTNAGQKGFLNFEATLTNDGNESSVKGKMDGVLIMKRSVPIPLEQVTEKS